MELNYKGLELYDVTQDNEALNNDKALKSDLWFIYLLY